MSNIDRLFLADITDDPGNNEPRLIYADWLEEQGDPRAEFIRVQCELARKKISKKVRVLLQQREQTLFREHGERWAREDLGQDPVAPIQRAFSVKAYIEEHIQQELTNPNTSDVHVPAPIPSQISYQRGFIGQLILSAGEFTSVQWPRLPIEELYITNIRRKHINAIAQRLPKNTLHTLHLSANEHLRSVSDPTIFPVLEEALQMLSHAGADMPRIQSLTLHNFNEKSAARAATLFLECFQGKHWQKLKHLALTALQLSLSEELAYDAHDLTDLHTLDVSHGFENDSRVEHLIESERLSSVRKIICLRNGIDYPDELKEYGRSYQKTIVVR